MRFIGPAFVLDVPTDWFVFSAPGYQTAFLSPKTPEGWRASFVVTHYAPEREGEGPAGAGTVGGSPGSAEGTRHVSCLSKYGCRRERPVLPAQHRLRALPTVPGAAPQITLPTSRRRW